MRAFDLVVSRHPVSPWWAEIARVLVPGGSYLAQQVGLASAFKLIEWFLGPQPGRRRRSPDVEAAEACDAGLEIVDQQSERLRMESLRRRLGGLLFAQGRLDGAGLHRRRLQGPAARSNS